MNQKQPHDADAIRIKGIVVPASWGKDGEVLSVAVSAFDETEYQLSDNELSRQLFGKLHQVVSIDGELNETRGGKKMIKVQSFKVEKGTGKTLLSLAVAAVFGLGCVSPALAAESKAPAPAAKQVEAAKPAAKAAAPAKKVKKAKKKSTKKTAKKAAKKQTVKANPDVQKAQAALTKAGFKTKADGFIGKNTSKALKGYQKKKGLKVSGKLDTATKKSLGI